MADRTISITEHDYRMANPRVPRMYDIQIDAFRDVTQKDIDTFGATLRAYGRLRTEMKKVHDELVADINGR